MYQTINNILEQENLDSSAAEAHGIAVGMLILESKATASIWLDVLGIDPQKNASYQNTLVDLFENTRLALYNEFNEFAFDLFLPDDEEPLSEQIESLKFWCVGFLSGLGITNPSINFSTEISEIITDIIEISKIDSNITEEKEEDANELMEIHEYLRAVIFTIRDYFVETTIEQIH